MQVIPVSSSQEVLRRVPGLFIGQHAGGGKAEQIFLRGFDIDHGTDVALTVDGMPVNMVSHAHGQGYADLHFVIPETIEKVDFSKGAYYADKGNFATAVGWRSNASHEGSSAFGAQATTTLANQMMFGTSTVTYVMPGLTSAASLARQGAIHGIVTTDASGNLASDGGALEGRVTALESFSG